MPDRAAPVVRDAAGPVRRSEQPVPMPAVDYPWGPAEAAGIVTVDGFDPVETDGPSTEALDESLRRAGAAGLAGRHAVIGVGSNRNPEVLRQKFLTAGIAPTLALAPQLIEGVAVGHSAHVSRRGYVAAAPYRVDGARTGLSVAWLDDRQLEALDATEPNYTRIALGPTWIYRSLRGLLGRTGRPLPLSPQPVVQALLRTVPGLAGAWPDGLAPADVAARLVDPDLRDRVRAALLAAGLVLPSGLGDP